MSDVLSLCCTPQGYQLELKDSNKQRIIEFLAKEGQDLDDVVFTTMDGKPFLIIGSWSTIGAIHEKVNDEFASKTTWGYWKPFYRGNYQDMRLGNLAMNCPNPKEHRRDWTYQFEYHKWRCSVCRTEFEFEGGKSPIRYDLPAGVRVDPLYQVPDGLIDLEDFTEWGFSDEYDTCSNCGKAVRTSPDSYGWQPDFFNFRDGDMLCRDCIREHAAEEYIEEHINRNKLLNTWIVNPEDHDWTKLDLDYENGLHPGQNDDPRKIIQVLKAEGIDVLFTGSVGQFDVNFSPWVRIQVLEEGHGWQQDNRLGGHAHPGKHQREAAL